MSKYKVKSNLNHDGEEYKAGSTIELDNATAKSLIKDGVLEANEDTDTDNDGGDQLSPKEKKAKEKEEKEAEELAEKNAKAEAKANEKGLHIVTEADLAKYPDLAKEYEVGDKIKMDDMPTDNDGGDDNL